MQARAEAHGREGPGSAQRVDRGAMEDLRAREWCQSDLGR